MKSPGGPATQEEPSMGGEAEAGEGAGEPWLQVGGWGLRKKHWRQRHTEDVWGEVIDIG